MKKLSALIVLALFASPMAFAQDGSSCAAAIPIAGSATPQTFNTDTTTATNWIAQIGPANSSTSNDVVYTFTTGAAVPTGSIVFNSSTSPSPAIYIANACTAPVFTGLVGNLDPGATFSLATLAINTQYWVLITGVGQAAANGVSNWTINPTFPVSLQNFEID